MSLPQPPRSHSLANEPPTRKRHAKAPEPTQGKKQWRRWRRTILRKTTRIRRIPTLGSLYALGFPPALHQENAVLLLRHSLGSYYPIASVSFARPEGARGGPERVTKPGCFQTSCSHLWQSVELAKLITFVVKSQPKKVLDPRLHFVCRSHQPDAENALKGVPRQPHKS
eukprot:gene16471-biopygen11306